MIEFSGASLRRGAKLLFEDATFQIHAGWRVGLTGRNGTGKSSLLAALRGTLATDCGDIRIAGNPSIAWVDQETPALPLSVLAFVCQGYAELTRLEAALETAQNEQDGVRIGHLHMQIQAIDGYAASARAARLLDGLGFAADEVTQPVASFSGGWRMRLNIARALMCRSELLLLDEPTNHLDLDALFWLQDWLRRYAGTLVLISHDRAFLDAVCTQILHIEQSGVRVYQGNYSQFERQRAERIQLEQIAYQKQQRQRAHLQAFVDRFRAKATKARQAQSRIKALQRMQLVAAAYADTPFDFAFATPQRLPSPMLRLEKAVLGYGQKAVVRGVNALIAPGARIGLLGPNGAGKSTLIRSIAGELPLLSGDQRKDPGVRIGYFAQHQLEQLDEQASPLLHLKRMDGQAREQSLRDFLGGFDFHGDHALAPVSSFSGGERARLALALIVYRAPSLLLLDEPTNHLDLDMRHALESALTLFSGAMILVSHDRHLLSACCDTFWLIDDGQCQVFEGDLDDYAASVSQTRSGPGDTARASQTTVTVPRGKQQKTLRDQLRKQETRMQGLQKKLSALDDALADPALYERDDAAEETAKLAGQQQALRAELEAVELQWMEVAERLETLN